MTLFPNGVVVAGFAGSAAGQAAARWGAAEARRRGAVLRLVHVSTTTAESSYPAPVLAAPRVTDTSRLRSRRILATAASELMREYPGLLVQTAPRDGRVLDILIDESRDAVVTVVGSRGEGQLAGVIFGSIAAGLAVSGHGCVVVVRAGTENVSPALSSPVVVGVDGSPSSDAALAFALDEAALRSAPAIVVDVWNDKPLEHALGRYPLEVNVESIDNAERGRLVEQLGPWTRKYPEVEVRPLVLRGRTASTLLRYIVDVAPQLLIVGSRGRGGFTSLLLGSTGMAMVGHATCPVAIVHDAATGIGRP